MLSVLIYKNGSNGNLQEESGFALNKLQDVKKEYGYVYLHHTRSRTDKAKPRLSCLQYKLSSSLFKNNSQ